MQYFRLVCWSVVLLECFLMSGSLLAQYRLPKHCTAEDYQPKTVVFRIDESRSVNWNGTGFSDEKLNQTLQSFGSFEIFQRFPKCQKPTSRLDARGRKLVDLTAIFVYKYTSEVAIEKVINAIYQTGAVEYAEPQFMDRLIYNPSDTLIGSEGTWWYLFNDFFQAWDIERGDTNIVIGITDTGVQLDHPDLEASIKYNYNDPPDGLDNDNDGYIDNFSGWDVGDNDNNPTHQTSAHGIHVTGLASATSDNITGLAGSGFSCRFLPIKISNAAGVLNGSYDGIVYAADQGCKIINCSWGSLFESNTARLVTEYATINKNALVVAGCGNNALQTDFYPASFPLVISVASHNSSGQKSPFSNFSYNVDVVGPGQSVLSTWVNGTYLVSNGTSMASPVVAGAAALVASRFPWMDALQIGEQIKATCTSIDSLNGNDSFRNRLGFGRLNAYEAVANSNVISTSLTVNELFDGNDEVFLVNDTIYLQFTLTNLLSTVNNISVEMLSSSNGISLLQSTATIGNMAMYDSFSNSLPFSFKINDAADINEEVVLEFKITGDGYERRVYYPVRVNVDYLNIRVNNINTTVTSNSHLGRNSGNNGLGFVFEGENLLYEGGFFCGIDTAKTSDNLRSVSATTNADFLMVQRIEISNSIVPQADFEATTIFNDQESVLPIPVKVKQRTSAYNDDGHRNYVMLEYTIVNTNTLPISNFYAGIFTDWDIQDYDQNKADENYSKKIGYAYNVQESGLFAGVSVLSPGPFLHYAIDNSPGGNGGLNLYDGFTKAEKYISLSTNRPQAGGENGNDIINVVSSGPYLIPANDSITVAFALLAGTSLNEIMSAADSSLLRYQEISLITGTHSTFSNCVTNCMVMPNPAKTEITFNVCGDYNGPFLIELFKANGILVYKEYLTASKNQSLSFDVSSLQQGLYQMIISTPTQICTQKIIINE